MRKKTYYIIICAGLSLRARYSSRYPIVVSTKPSSCDLGGCDRVYSIACDSIAGARNIVGACMNPATVGAKFLFEV